MHMISTEFAAILQKMAREYQQNPTISRRGDPNELNFRVKEVFLAKVTTKITASYDVSNPGSGVVELYTPDPADTRPIEERGYATLDEPVDRSAVQPWTYTPTTVDVTNPFDSTFEVDTFLLVIMIRGQWIPVVGGGGGGSTFFWGYLEEVICDYDDDTSYVASELYRGTQEALSPQRDDGNYDVQDPFGFAARYPDSMLVSETGEGALVRVEKLYPGNFWAISAIRIIPDCTGEGGTNNPT